MAEQDPLGRIATLAAQSEQRLPEIQQAETDYFERERTRARRDIAKLISRAYVVIVGVIILYLIYRGVFCNDENAFKDLIEVVKIALLPVMTFVIGHYFGSASK